MRIEDTSRNLIRIDSAVEFFAKERKEKTTLKRFRLATLFSLIFLILLLPPILSGVAQGGDYHTDHLNDPTDAFPNDYAPMVIPVNGKGVTVAPEIRCTTLEGGVFKPYHYPCKSAQTLFVDDDWGDKDANYTYLFEDWTDYDWNDINVSLYAVTDDVITVEIHLKDREAAWKNPFSVEITPEDLTVDVHWNSTDYPENHVVRVNSDENVSIELFNESIPGDAAFMTIIPITPPVASFVYSPLYPQVCKDVTFDASASTPDGGYIVNYTWNFGDSNITTVTYPIIIHHYDSPGNYTVTLKVKDSEGKWDTVSKVITVTPRKYTLTITSTSGGTTDPVPSKYLYNEGTVVRVRAISNTGYVFNHWKLDEVNVGSANPIDVTMNANHTLQAVFTEITYTLTITATTGGTTSPSPGNHVYSSGTNVPVTVTPQDGYQFDHWELDGFDVGSANPYTVTMNANHTLHAVFKEVPPPPPPPPVGGHAIPIDKRHFLAPKSGLIPGIGLAFILLAAMTATIVLIRRKDKTLKRQR